MDQEFERFTACAEAYGASPSRWPERDRLLFRRFAETPEGAAVLALAARTDNFLDAWHPEPASEELAARITGAAVGPSKRSHRRTWWALAFTACALGGFAIGFGFAPADPSPELVSELLVGPSDIQGIGL